jgi:uroporphyrinogen-III synthase
VPRVLITRSPHQASALADALRAHGIEPILIPTIEIAPPTTYASLDDAICNLANFHWLIFTSANAVEAFAQRRTLLASSSSVTNQVPQGFSLGSHSPLKRDGALAPDIQIAAIGPATATALELIGMKPTLIPPKAIAESLAEVLTPHALQPDGTPTRFLLVRAEEARNVLEEQLKTAKAELTIASAYRNILPEASISAIRELFKTHPPDAISFTSSSTATNLIALLEAAHLTLPLNILRISIGPITSQTLRALNLPPHAEADAPSVASLSEKLLEVLRLK